MSESCEKKSPFFPHSVKTFGGRGRSLTLGIGGNVRADIIMLNGFPSAAGCPYPDTAHSLPSDAGRLRIIQL